MGENRALMRGISGCEEGRLPRHLSRASTITSAGRRCEARLAYLSRLRGRSTRSIERGGWGKTLSRLRLSVTWPAPPPQPSPASGRGGAAARAEIRNSGRQFTPPAQSLYQPKLQQQRALEHREIVIRNHGQHGVALRRDVGVDAFHVVDLVTQIRLEDRGAVDHRARRERLQRDAADA